jgi:hypothetical protein
MEVSKAKIDTLIPFLKEMSAGDLSILEALPETLRQEETARLVTIPGSRNDLLWSQMVALNWMKLGEPLEEHPASKVYIVSREALEPLETLLIQFKRDGLPDLFNELRREIPRLIGPRVVAAGGAPSDLALMLAGIVEGTMRRWIRPDLHDEFLKAVFDRSNDLRSQPKG